MSQSKKIFAFIIALVMIISLFPAVVSADGTSVVYLTVENTTYSAEEGAPWDGKLLDTIPVEITEGETKIVDVITSGLSEKGHAQTGAEEGYITDINGLGEFSSGKTGGWMVSLNDWFINAGIDAFYVSDGDIINVRFTSTGFGEDIGSSWSNNIKNLSDILFSAGELNEDFSSEVYEYTLTIPSGTESIKVTPTAVNKNFQTRIYLNAEFVDGETEKYIEGEAELENILCGVSAPGEVPSEFGFYKRTEEIPVSDGDIIYVACGLSYWNSMNNGEFGSGAEEVPGTVYSFNIVKENPEININAGIYDYTALTYKENNPQCSAVVSENGVVYETESFTVAENTTVLDALKEILNNAQIPYSLDSYSSYISSVGGLSEMDCTPQSGWMISVNDEFLSVGANEAVLNDGDTIKLHYSVEGWGTDVGSYFTGGPVVKKLVVGGVTTKITSNTVYADENDWTGTTTYYLGEYREGKKNTEIEGDGSHENPFIIPVEVPSRTDITSLTAKLETSLHEKYLIIGEGEGLTNILEPTNYEDDVTFSIETLGGFVKNYYTVKVKKKSSGGGGGGGSSAPEEEEVPEEVIPPAEEEKIDIIVNFEDTKGHWAENYIQRLASQNIINGKTEKSFAPDDKITRAELVTLLYRLSGSEETYQKSNFGDVKESDWHMQAISWAEEKGIAGGMGKGEFKPDEYVTREQTAVFIIRFCEYMGYEFKMAEEKEFSDVFDFSEWSGTAVSKAQKYGIINGFEDGTFAPKETSTRAQTAKMLCNLLDNHIKE